MKFIDVCRLLPLKTEIELTEIAQNMEKAEFIGSHTVREIVYQSFWNKFKDHSVLSVNPVGEYKVTMKVVKE